ncbi:hypothetical protein EYR41_009638 [Orbilia oligospora]|uniref:Uncharacterized protein n=1 Tax=Orbilia oligospora TaxID=2813651 RepID=A0A8H2DQL5_ORBOL|nr:hypothetical protein TWF132_002918 [Orbilia oligospora]TGJ65690.1 hypothetical protein EYR41_009638 [Orbilia oligospora]
MVLFLVIGPTFNWIWHAEPWAEDWLSLRLALRSAFALNQTPGSSYEKGYRDRPGENELRFDRVLRQPTEIPGSPPTS